MSVTSTLRMAFEDTGFFGPVSIFDEEECRHIRRLLYAAPPPLDWIKGAAANSQTYHSIGSHPAIVERVAELIGPNIILWGASLIRRWPGQIHHWHTDIETSADAGGTVTVWIGLKNTTRQSALRLISRSHRFGMTVQERTQRALIPRKLVATEDVVRWATALDPQSGLVESDMRDGDAILCDGRLWHGSYNGTRKKTRTALLLQYAAPDRPIHIPDYDRPDYPFGVLDEPRPPCVMVRGSASDVSNRIVAGPAPHGHSRPLSWVKTLDLPVKWDQCNGWKPYIIHHGPTRCLTQLTCHVSAFDAKKTSIEPLPHAEEALLVMLEGEAELVIGGGESRRTETIHPGSFLYYPAGQRHAIHNKSTAPARYLMLKWRNAVRANERSLPTGVFRYHEAAIDQWAHGRRGVASIFRGSTRYLEKLHCHLRTLRHGAEYEPRVNAYDTTILVLRGTVETLGQRVSSPGVVFCSAGERHALRNVADDTPAVCLTFEFHGRREPSAPPLRRRLVALARWELPELVPLWAKRAIHMIVPRVRKMAPKLARRSALVGTVRYNPAAVTNAKGGPARTIPENASARYATTSRRDGTR